ncbi:MAG: Bax inhibitor-1/YccA family protein [Gammaproteobacteria bacterium]|nr:Bax inhibitor-1/YccA family protein [Gammaproteobacteria bacterium]
MDYNVSTLSRGQTSTLEVNKVLRNTYWLLSMTLLFSALTAAISMTLNLGFVAYIVCIIAAFAMLFVVHRTADSGKGIWAIFGFTGLMGFALGPILSAYTALHGAGIVMQALGGTGVVFLGLSGYALTTKKDFSFMGGFLFAGLIILVLGGLINIFVGSSAAQLGLACISMLVFSGLILFDTSRIIHGGETNYIRATVALYLDIYNLFTTMLQLLGFASDD